MISANQQIFFLHRKTIYAYTGLKDKIEAPSVLIAYYQKSCLGNKNPDQWLEIKLKKNGITQFRRERMREREIHVLKSLESQRGEKIQRG